MIMKEKMIQLRVAAVHFRQVPEHKSVHTVLCLCYKDKDLCCVHIIDGAED